MFTVNVFGDMLLTYDTLHVNIVKFTVSNIAIMHLSLAAYPFLSLYSNSILSAYSVKQCFN
jgi:hypothetical protein